MEPIRLFIVDDHDLFRAGIRSLLEKLSDIEFVGEAGTGREALQRIQTCSPDIVLMDILMPEMNGLDSTALVTARFPKVRVIMLSMNSAEEYVAQSLRAGASGYLLKNVSPMELELAIKTVARGETFLSSAISKQVLEGYFRRVGPQAGSEQGLSERQKEVLRLVAEGLRTKEIAKKLGLSVKTVEMHRAKLMAVLDIHNLPGLVRYAIRMGLIDADQ